MKFKLFRYEKLASEPPERKYVPIRQLGISQFVYVRKPKKNEYAHQGNT